MKGERGILDKALRHALAGTGAHVETATVFAALDWRLAGRRPGNAPHSIYQVLNHMVYWQDWVVEWFDGHNPELPKHAPGSWPGEPGPSSGKEWNNVVRRFGNGLETLTRRAGETDLFSQRARKSRLEMLHTIASHNSYHAGQVVVLRQMMGAWPPPSGGLTW